MVAAIYEEGIRSRNATFETEVPSWAAFDAAHPEHRLVADESGRVVGWAALSPLSARQCYRGVAETSVFPENRASLTLHVACGFRVVGIHERIARLDGVWRDTVLMERRSPAW